MLTGAGAFRFVFQPLMSAFRGYRDGQADCQARLAPIGLRLVRRHSWRDATSSTLKTIWPVLLLAVVLDIYYQHHLFGQISAPLTALIAVLLALVPYALSRGLCNRWFTRQLSQHSA